MIVQLAEETCEELNVSHFIWSIISALRAACPLLRHDRSARLTLLKLHLFTIVQGKWYEIKYSAASVAESRVLSLALRLLPPSESWTYC